MASRFAARGLCGIGVDRAAAAAALLAAVLLVAVPLLPTAARADPLDPPAVAQIAATAQRQASVTWAASPAAVAALARSLGLAPTGALLDEAEDLAVSGSDALHEALADGIRMWVRDRPCRAQVEVTRIAAEGARVRFSCPGPVAGARIRIAVLQPVDPRYRTLAVAGTDAGVERLVFSGEAPERRIALDPASARLVGAPPSPPPHGFGHAGGSSQVEAELLATVDRRGVGVVAALLLGLVLGAAHGLRPGHGKAAAAGYLAGAGGRPTDVAWLAGTVAVVHTWSVLAVGMGLHLAAQLPGGPALSAWLQVTGGGIVALAGAWLLVRRLRSPVAPEAAGAGRPGRGGIAALAIGSGLLPSPAPLLVLATAAAGDRLPLGLLVVAGFGAGLALTIGAVALAAVLGRDLLLRPAASPRLLRALPVVGALGVVGLGVVAAARGLDALLP
jgi:nickel/cobalt transporter (NicO) family protein